jgi:hypothetical protein
LLADNWIRAALKNVEEVDKQSQVKERDYGRSLGSSSQIGTEPQQIRRIVPPHTRCG